jgi:tRNA-binding EMAP/Myf-like protein
MAAVIMRCRQDVLYGDRIWLADVEIGCGYQPQIVWGGLPLPYEGDLVPVAPPGSWLPQGKMRRRRYRCEVSEGMLCSLAELGWDLSVTDRVALLDEGAGLLPGESLDSRESDRCGQPQAPAGASPARIAIPASEHACRYGHKSPATLVALRLLLRPGPVRARNAANARSGRRPLRACGPNNVMVYRFVKT